MARNLFGVIAWKGKSKSNHVFCFKRNDGSDSLMCLGGFLCCWLVHILPTAEITTQTCVVKQIYNSDVLQTPCAHTEYKHPHVRRELKQKLFIPTYTNHGPHKPASISSGRVRKNKHTRTQATLKHVPSFPGSVYSIKWGFTFDLLGFFFLSLQTSRFCTCGCQQLGHTIIMNHQAVILLNFKNTYVTVSVSKLYFNEHFIHDCMSVKKQHSFNSWLDNQLIPRIVVFDNLRTMPSLSS